MILTFNLFNFFLFCVKVPYNVEKFHRVKFLKSFNVKISMKFSRLENFMKFYISSGKMCIDIIYRCKTFLIFRSYHFNYTSSCSYGCCSSSSCWGVALQKNLRLRRLKSDRGEIWQDCSSSKFVYIR